MSFNIIPGILSIILLLGCFLDLPYGYFILVRIVVCGSACYFAYFAYEKRVKWATWLFGVIAALFNPLIKFHFDRELWQVFDIMAAIVFVVGIISLKRHSTNSSEESQRP